LRAFVKSVMTIWAAGNCVGILLVCIGLAVAPPAPSAVPAPIAPHFTPGEEIAPLVVAEIDAAAESIRLQGYGFTHPAIAAALIRAHKRGVDVRLVLDRSNRTASHSQAPRCHRAGVWVRYDASHQIAHNKVIVIDGRTVLTGSFNWTTAANDHNAENLVRLRSAEVAAAYLKNWSAHAEHSEP
jgi:phosphatidylserine/phosphatidylglycerophosphate/cardiolipin synthase-like enzyme